jgi:hypothetical protein
LTEIAFTNISSDRHHSLIFFRQKIDSLRTKILHLEVSMNRVGILCIFVLSILLSPFSDGRAESTNKTSSSRTILISFDGAQPEVIEKLLEQRKLPRNGGFAELIDKGTRAQGMTSVLPTLTATNHITIATGAYPERTNIPMNTFHDTESPLTATTSGFSAAIGAETLWEAAKRQGKKVVTIAFAGADGRGDDRRGDQTLGFGVRDGFSFVKFMNASHFDAASADAWNLRSQPCEFKKANVGTATANQVFFQTFSLGQVFVNVLVCDTVFDGQERYDTAFFDFDKNLSNSFIARMRRDEHRSSRSGNEHDQRGDLGRGRECLYQPAGTRA